MARLLLLFYYIVVVLKENILYIREKLLFELIIYKTLGIISIKVVRFASAHAESFYRPRD